VTADDRGHLQVADVNAGGATWPERAGSLERYFEALTALAQPPKPIAIEGTPPYR
jgi:hypothetical protein